MSANLTLTGNHRFTNIGASCNCSCQKTDFRTANLCRNVFTIQQNELFTFPFVMPTSNLLWSIGVIFVFAVLANQLVLRRLRRADVIEVLKTGE